ncbi:MAG: DUF1778 domain-containing protein [Alphaproteobacteria bacterium]|nr:DUF1778 domain-containing protein [Alphaproteobacteria bacterium]
MIQYSDATALVAETKSTRKELRMKPTVAAKIRDMAAMVGMDESTFITSAAFQKAQEVEKEQFVTTLDESQFDAFAEAAVAPGERNDALSEVIRHSHDLLVDG